MQALEVFSRLLGLHLGVIPSCHCGWYLQAVKRSSLNLVQQLRHGCSCSQGSWVLTDKQQCWYLNPSHQPLITLTLCPFTSPIPVKHMTNRSCLASTSALLLAGHVLGSVLPLMLRPEANAVPG